MDASDGRFWILHSASNSVKADRILHRVIANDSHLDSAWLPMQLLERVAEMGIFKGLHLDYDHREVPDVEFDVDDAPVEYLKMHSEGEKRGTSRADIFTGVPIGQRNLVHVGI